jgi:prolyl-tRNA editing enzyme YbaK/EbsC (Cys-tRNA(Pro) deacylase)
LTQSPSMRQPVTTTPESRSTAEAAVAPPSRPEGFQRVSDALAARGHAHAPCWLDVSARTSQEAADALGVALGQIAKSVVFRRKVDDQAVLVIASGDRRVDEHKLALLAGAVGRADASFVKQRTGFAIGGVSPVGLAGTALMLIDRELLRFSEIWAAAGHPNGVFQLSPAELQALTGAPLVDVVQA